MNTDETQIFSKDPPNVLDPFPPEVDQKTDLDTGTLKFICVHLWLNKMG